MEQDLIQMGTVAILFLLFMKEFFAYLKNKKTNGSNNTINRSVLSELKLLNENHLNQIDKSIRDGNKDIVQAINNSSQKQIEMLGRIEGRLDR